MLFSVWIVFGEINWLCNGILIVTEASVTSGSQPSILDVVSSDESSPGIEEYQSEEVANEEPVIEVSSDDAAEHKCGTHSSVGVQETAVVLLDGQEGNALEEIIPTEKSPNCEGGSCLTTTNGSDSDEHFECSQKRNTHFVVYSNALTCSSGPQATEVVCGQIEENITYDGSYGGFCTQGASFNVHFEDVTLDNITHSAEDQMCACSPKNSDNVNKLSGSGEKNSESNCDIRSVCQSSNLCDRDHNVEYQVLSPKSAAKLKAEEAKFDASHHTAKFDSQVKASSGKV